MGVLGKTEGLYAVFHAKMCYLQKGYGLGVGWKIPEFQKIPQSLLFYLAFLLCFCGGIGPGQSFCPAGMI